MSFDRAAMCKAWPRLSGPLRLLERWDAPRGIILESDPESTFEAAMALAAHLGGSLVKLEAHPITKEEWRDQVGRYVDRKAPPAALFAMRKERLCVVVLRLDRQREWLQLSLKWPMDSGKEPGCGYNVIATAENAEEIPANVRSHFHVVRKTGRRRGAI